MRIGELSVAFGIPVETIRYYEREKLLPAAGRTAANYRIYEPVHIDRLRFIVNCRALDMTLGEIRALLRFHDRPSADCSGVSELLDEHIGHVSKRIAELELLERQLHRLRAACRKGVTTTSCGILRSLNDATTRRGSKGKVHTKTGV